MKPQIEEIENAALIITPVGRLDIYTSVDFEEDVNAAVRFYRTKRLILNFEKITYISSGGLRVILELQKKMSSIGSMELQNVCPEVMEIFKTTGFNKILNITEDSENQ